MGKMIIIEPGGTTRALPMNTEPSLEELQAAVGGDIELITSAATWDGEPAQVYCHESGKLLGLAPNLPATAYVNICIHDPGSYAVLDDVLVGPVVILVGDARAK